jgi:hypothetical protein
MSHPDAHRKTQSLAGKRTKTPRIPSFDSYRLLFPPPHNTTNPFYGVSSPQSLLIIAPDNFIPVLQPLVQHKNQSRMPTLAVSISQLKAFFSGVDDPEIIKQGILYAHENLSVRYVMLVGDAHLFPVRYMFYHCLSIYYSDAHIPIPTDGDYFASDLYYSNLYHHTGNYPNLSPGSFDNWDANGNGYYNEGWWNGPPYTGPDGDPNPDNVDGYPDVAVGRVPAHSVTDVTAYVNKIVNYESSTPRYRISRGRKFTFVADTLYDNGAATPGLITQSGLMDSPFVSANYLIIENGSNPPPTTENWKNAGGLDVANSANESDWVSYDGHGGPKVWGYNGVFGESDVAHVKSDSLPVVFAAGCQTGEFIMDFPWNGQYMDVQGTKHQFRRPATTDGYIEDILNQPKKWLLTSSNSCPSNPVIMPKPNPYDFDRGLVGDQGFAHSWLIANAPGGGIAYFGEMGVSEDWMAVELETYVLAAYHNEVNPILGDVYLKGQRQYWVNHQSDQPGTPESSLRFFLGWMVFFGDPSLRLPRILDPCQPLRLEVQNLQDALSMGEILPKDRPTAEVYLTNLRSQLVACETSWPPKR